MTDVILLGAGFSRAISPLMPLLCDLSKELRNKVPNVPSDNVEHWMTYLSQSHPWLTEHENLRNRALFLELTEDIRNTLSKKTEEALKLCPECPLWLQQLMQRCHDHKISIITLNYDTLVESAVQFISVGKDSQGKDQHLSLDDIYPVPMTPANKRREGIYLGGERIESFNFFKLHGSINWYYSGASMSTGETIYFSKVQRWDTAKDHANKSEYETTRFLSDKVPLIVPPLIEKVSYFQHETIRTVWGLAGQTIRSANRLICMGYSLPETDLSFRFFLEKNAPTSHISLYIVNVDTTSTEHYQKLIGHCYQVDGRHTGRILDELLVSDLFPTN